MHNRLFILEAHQPILEPEVSTHDGPRYYSPWRDEPRPLRGILHGLFVYVPVQRYWLRVGQSPGIDSVTRDLAVDLVLRSSMKLDIGIEQLERHGRFTNFGKVVLRELRTSVDELRNECNRLGLPDDAPAHYCEPDGTIRPERHQDGTRITVREFIQDHKKRFKPLENEARISVI